MHQKYRDSVNQRKLKEYISNFVKKILKVKTISSLYYEICKNIKYWFKLTKTDNLILQHVYKIAYDDCLLRKKNWLSTYVKKILSDYGFAYVWDSPDTVCEKTF